MDFEHRQIKKSHCHRISIEFDVTGDINLVECQQIASSLVTSIPLLCDCLRLCAPPSRRVEVNSSKVSVQPLPKKTYSQVQLPPM